MGGGLELPPPPLATLLLALASSPQVLENWPVLGSRTAVFFELLKSCGALEKFFGKRFFVEIAWKIFVKIFFYLEIAWKIFVKTFFFFFFFFEIAWKIFVKTFFVFVFWRALALVSLVLGLGLEHSCPWPRECLSLERLSLALALASDFFCVLGLGLDLCVLDSTSGNYRIFVEEVLLEIGFIEEMRATWGNKDVPQTFCTISFTREKVI